MCGGCAIFFMIFDRRISDPEHIIEELGFIMQKSLPYEKALALKYFSVLYQLSRLNALKWH